MKRSFRFIKVLLFVILLIFCGRNNKVFASDPDEVLYTTTGGTWVQVNETTWTMDKNNDGVVDVTLVKNGDIWKYYFTVADDKAEYYGWEEEIPEGYEIEGKGSRDNPIVFKENGVIKNKPTEEVTLPVGGIKLSKIVSGSGIDESKNFRFDIVLSSDEEGLQEFLNGTVLLGGISFKDGVGFTYLSNGGVVELTGIPAGINYSIKEVGADGYQTSWSVNGVIEKDNGVQGSIIENKISEVVCTNSKENEGGTPDTPEIPVEPETVKLGVKKIVEGTETDEEFNFNIAFWNLEPNKSYTDGVKVTFTSDASGVADVGFTLKNGESLILDNLPTGTQYQILEGDSNYIASYNISGSTDVVQQKGENLIPNKSLATSKETLGKDEENVVTFVNTKEDIPVDYVSLYVKKVWDDQENLYSKRPSEITVYLQQNDDVIATVNLNEESNWEAKFTGLDKYESDGKTEYKYSVKEKSVANYEVNIAETQEEGYDLAYTVTNTLIDTGKLVLRKEVQGIDNYQKKFKFNITLLNDENLPVTGTYPLVGGGSVVFNEEGTATIEISDSETVSIDSIPIGTKYTVKEQSYGNFKTDYTNESGTISFDDSIVTVTNTYINHHNIIVSKTVSGNMGNKTDEFTFKLHLEQGTSEVELGEITYKKTSSDGSVQEGVVVLNEGNDYEFTLSHKDEIVFKDIPVGAFYEVTEMDGEEKGYTVKSKNTYGTVEDVNISVPFNNIKNISIPTGGVTNLGILLGIGGISVFIILGLLRRRSKKR